MFGELPKMFGRGFVVGYLLPTALITAAIALSLHAVGYIQVDMVLKKTVVDADEKVLAIRLGLGVAILWVLALVLLVINFPLIRILEGYGRINPARLWEWWPHYLFDTMAPRLGALDQKRKTGPANEAEDSERRTLRERLAVELPERKDLILPTRFGNVVRAFERYPQIIYGIEPIRTWMRLQAVIPQDYGQMLDDAKTMLDFYVNLWFGAILVAAIVFGGLLHDCYLTLSSPYAAASGVTIVIALMTAVGSAKQAQGTAAQWGELVKGAFDLYRGELCKQLGLEMPASIDQERKMWEAMGQTMLYRQADYANKLTEFRAPGSPPD